MLVCVDARHHGNCRDHLAFRRMIAGKTIIFFNAHGGAKKQCRAKFSLAVIAHPKPVESELQALEKRCLLKSCKISV